MNKLKLAVIGKDVSKSSSPRMHSFIARSMGNGVEYSKISIPESEFSGRAEELFEKLDGFNVTIPYKLTIMPYLNEVRGDALVFGAVNTVTTRGRTGDNTDGLGFSLMLKNNGVDVKDCEVLILGAGGAGRSAAKKLADAGARVSIYNRHFEKAKSVADEFNLTALEEIPVKPYSVIVNATGVGMHETEGISPVGADLIKLCETAVDLIYEPPKSQFLRLAEGLGKKTINGSAMLFYQAYFAECIFFGVQPDEEQAKSLFLKYIKEQ